MRRFQEELARRRSEEASRIGARIAALREQHHYTQEAAAAKLKVAYRTYQSWEQGTSVPRWAMRERIAKFYKVPIEEINGPPAPAIQTAPLPEVEELHRRLDDIYALIETLVGDELVQAALKERRQELERRGEGGR